MNTTSISSNVVPAATESGVLPKKPQGFAALTPEQRAAISSKGGKSAHAKGTAHKWTKETAASAGSKGGKAPHKVRGRTVVAEKGIHGS